jgi:hypothetical protein
MRAASLAAVAVVALAGAAACNAILGNGQRSLYDADASTDAANEASPGGDEASTSGDAPTGVSPDAAKDVGAGDASDATTGTFDAPPDGPTPPSDGACGDASSDSLNCGVCGHSCIGAPCVGGLCQPTVLVSNIDPPLAMFGDATALWWSSGGPIFTCGKSGCGGTPVKETAPLFGSLIYMAPIGDQIFFTAQTTVADGGTQAEIEVWTKYSVQPPKPLVSGLGQPRSLVACGSAVCWLDQTPGGANTYTVDSCPAGGCAAPNVVTTGNALNEIASDGQTVFMAAVDAISTCPLTGCAGPMPLLSQTQPESLLVSGGRLVWGDGQNSVNTCMLPACSPITLAKNVTWPHGVAFDGTTVYFTTYEPGGALYAVDAGGGVAPRVLVPNLPTPEHVVVDATRVYFSTTGNGVSGAAQIAWVAK